MSRMRVLFLAAVLVCLPIACRRADPIYRVSGTITFNGHPIPAGLVFFDPEETEGTTGLQGFASIKDGRFDTATEGRGVAGGKYTMRILGFDGKTGNEAPLGNALFREYQEKRDLPKADTELDLRVPVVRAN